MAESRRVKRSKSKAVLRFHESCANRTGSEHEASRWARRLGVVEDAPWKTSLLRQFLADLEQHGGEIPEPHTLPPLFSSQQKDICLVSFHIQVSSFCNFKTASLC